MDGSLLAALKAKIAGLQAVLAQAEAEGMKLNEAQTEAVIIDPLLATLGYGPLETHKQGHDAVTKGIPDYAVLPNTNHKWFLEVKRLDLTLKDGEAHQAVSYAVAQGAEWAVLTNGRAWYFYNAHYQKPLAEKRVFPIQDVFNDTQAVEMLAYLSRESMMGGGLTQAWIASRTADIIRHQFKTPNSPVRKALKKAIGEELHTQVTDSIIGDIIERQIFAGASSPPVSDSAISVTIPTQPIEPPAQVVPEPDDLFTLDYLEQHPDIVTNKKPVVLKLLGGSTQPIKSWSILVQKTLVAIGSKHGLPLLPFVGSVKGKKYFLNTSPVRADGKPMITYVSVPVNGTTIFADMNRSAINTVQGLFLLLKAVHAPIDAVKVKTE